MDPMLILVALLAGYPVVMVAVGMFIQLTGRNIDVHKRDTIMSPVHIGENVPPVRVQRSYDAVEALAGRDGVLLVVGSSLTVMSGLRFVKRAAKLGIPVVIVNRGATRGDEHATYTLEDGCSEFLTALAS